jgi:DNA-binding CsgD family transcriptional regulator
MNLEKIFEHINNIDYFISMDGALDELECNTFAKANDGKFIGGNLNMALSAGMSTSKEFIGLCDYDLVTLEQARRSTANDNVVMKTGLIQMFTEPFTITNGKPMLATCIKAPLRTKTNKVLGIVGMSFVQDYSSYLNGPANPYGFTERQLDCLYYLVKGMSIKLIAKTLALSPRTVEHYLETLKQKLDCDTRADFIAKALSLPIIKNRL